MEKGHFSERNARNVIRSILEGIEYLHSKGIAHRDLKPENIMLVDKDSLAIKIADFGLSRTIDEGSFMSTLCGTPSYAAPEIIQKKGYTTSVDIWSVGVIAYVLLSQELPFYSKGGDVAELCKEVVKGVVVFRRKAVWDTVSQEAKDFILRLLRVNPDERPTAFDALDDPWFMKDMGDDSVIDELLPEPEPEPEPEQEALSEPVEKKLCPTI